VYAPELSLATHDLPPLARVTAQRVFAILYKKQNQVLGSLPNT
jgi:hypothetical protein